MHDENLHVDVIYKKITQKVLSQGSLRNTRSATVISHFGNFIEMDLTLGLPLLTTKRMAIKTMMGELLWFVNFENTLSQLKHRTFGDANADKWTIWTDDWERWKKSEQGKSYYANHPEVPADSFGEIYGKQWGKQLESAIDKIKNNPMDRRILVDSWSFDELDDMVLPPCHYSYQFYVDNGRLDIMWIQRSADVGLGLPMNIGSYAMLLIMVAKYTGLNPRMLKGCLGDTHVYENSIDALEEQMKRTPLPMMDIDMSKLPDLVGDTFLEAVSNLTADDFMDFFEGYKSHEKINIELLVGGS